ncbi:tripartite tricarboxylate transporter permease [Halalkalibacter alkaliphilus]|uniref:Tripartite tricarboxylate transporter permease n=2 Tax=Bacillaceae TaxID=186817 RepID=A0A9X2I6D9_9BACI|nr:tripartite tricarboxylate transporter permease [Halalkalibacter alkaliphilus]MCL7748852.1 tripartite tricarboxylate transporter permease [Halalkalibacter alkaliphilus]
MEVVLSGLQEVLTLHNILIILASLALGMIVGCIPGLTVTLGIILLLPLTYSFTSASTAIIALLAVYVGGMYGGSISAILLNTPGTNAAIATTFDGYPLAKKGKVKKALDVSLFASVVGGLLAGLLLLFGSGLIASLVSGFTSTEYFALSILGLSLIAGVSGDNIFKGILGGLIGLFISIIGLDVVTGVSRFSFDTMLLYQGITIMPAMIAFIALIQVMIKSAEYINAKGNNGNISKIDNEGLTGKERRSIMPAILRSTGISSIIGVMPGVGGGVSQFISYNEAKRTSKHPEEFGKGSLEGVAAAESSNNTVVGTSMMPLLTLGIPGDGVTAILLGAFILHGIVPGPTMFTNQGTVAYAIIFGLIIANILLFFVALIFTRQVAKIVQVRYSYLGPLIITFCFAGAFAANGSRNEVILMMGLLAITYVLVKLGISVIPIMLGMILAPIMEQNFVNSMTIYSGDLLIFFKRPISLAILILTVILVWSFIRVNKKVAKISAEQEKNVQS